MSAWTSVRACGDMTILLAAGGRTHYARVLARPPHPACGRYRAVRPRAMVRDQRERRMARSLLALIAVAAFGLCLVPDDASARAGAVRGSRSVGGFHHGGAGAFVRRP